MTVLRDISVLWSLVHTLIMFGLLFEPRYGPRKNLTLILSTMVPLILINFLLFMLVGADAFAPLMLLTLSLPSLIVFWLLSKHRYGRFFFTFCLVDTVVLEITFLTQVLDHYLMGGQSIFLFVVRLLIFPLLELLIIKRLRSYYRQVQNNVNHGWGNFAMISVIFYILLTLLASYPTLITERPEDLPALCLVFVLMPALYVHAFVTLRNQSLLAKAREQDSILRLQVANMAARLEELNEADRKFRMERHNFRHKLKAIASLAEAGHYKELQQLLEEYSESIRETQVVRHSKSPVIDALLTAYLKRAEAKQIRVSYGFAFPDPIPVSETELATVLANALENAIHACEKLSVEQRFMDIKVLDHPGFMIKIVNSFDGNVTFDEQEIPVTGQEDHGFGTRSIVTFCEKHGAFYRFRAEGNRFTLYLNF